MKKLRLYTSIFLSLVAICCFILLIAEPMTSEAFLLKLIAFIGTIYLSIIAYKILPKEYYYKFFLNDSSN